MDLLSALIRGSKAWANPIAEAYASGNRDVAITIVRPAGLPVFDRVTGGYTETQDTTIFTGLARIWPVQGSAQVTVGEDVQDISQVKISVDNYDGTHPRLEDLVIVGATPEADDANVSRRVFTIADVEVGGYFNTGWTFTGTGVAESRRNP